VKGERTRGDRATTVVEPMARRAVACGSEGGPNLSCRWTVSGRWGWWGGTVEKKHAVEM
jgi:hypothetical protein